MTARPNRTSGGLQNVNDPCEQWVSAVPRPVGGSRNVSVVEATEGNDDDGRLEVFVEPFEEANPGAHVTDAVAAIEAHGIDVDLGALASIAEGPLDDLIAGASEALRVAFERGATAVQLRIERS